MGTAPMGKAAKAGGRGALVAHVVVVCTLLGVIVALLRSRAPTTDAEGQHGRCLPCSPSVGASADVAMGVSPDSADAFPALVKELQAAAALIEQLKSEVAHQSDRIGQLTAVPREGGSYSDRYVPWFPSKQRDAAAKDKGLAALLRQIALNGEVLAAVSNMALAGDGGMLQTFVESVKRAGIANAMVVAIDAQTKRQVEKWGLPVHHMTIQLQGAQKKLGMSNHGVSGLKFRILRQFVELGYAVLLSDVDIVFLRNPFHHLHRDVDLESMSDGWDNATAYGFNDVYDDPAMGWARFAHSMRQVVFNSGLFYLRPTQATLDFLDMIIARLERESAWDQAVFNEEAAFPASPVHASPHIRRRTMDYMLFMNSKVLFRTVRKMDHLKTHLPVSIHVNYHNDKHQRMKAIIQRYVHMDEHALDNFPDGSHW